MVGKDFIYRGFNIWTRQPLDQTYLVESKRMGKKVFLKIDQAHQYTVNTSDLNNSKREDCAAMSQILNVLSKDAFSQLGMLQLGNRPRFFDSSKPVLIPDMNM